MICTDNIQWFAAPVEGKTNLPVFFYKDRVFRGITQKYATDYSELFASALITTLTDLRLIPETWITEEYVEGFEFLIEQEKLPYTIYPQEWTFMMLKQAALCVLNVNKISEQYGYETYDCHGFNVLYNGGWPQFIDIGSFQKKTASTWAALDEFLRCYLFPLKCWSEGNFYLAHRILADNYWNRFLPKETYYHVGFESWLQRPTNFDELIHCVNQFSEKKHHSLWANYHDEYYAENGTLKQHSRFEKIVSIVKELPIQTAHDMASNAGVFAKRLLESTNIKHILCSDKDVNAINTCFERCINDTSLKNNISCVLLNFMAPIQNYGNATLTDRLGSDAVFALALSHHLILTDHSPIELILNNIKHYARKYVFIEFMPWTHINIHTRTAEKHNAFYTEKWFQAAFESVFELFHIERLELNRILYCGKVRP